MELWSLRTPVTQAKRHLEFAKDDEDREKYEAALTLYQLGERARHGHDRMAHHSNISRQPERRGNLLEHVTKSPSSSCVAPRHVRVLRRDDIISGKVGNFPHQKKSLGCSTETLRNLYNKSVPSPTLKNIVYKRPKLTKETEIKRHNCYTCCISGECYHKIEPDLCCEVVRGSIHARTCIVCGNHCKQKPKVADGKPHELACICNSRSCHHIDIGNQIFKQELGIPRKTPPRTDFSESARKKCSSTVQKKGKKDQCIDLHRIPASYSIKEFRSSALEDHPYVDLNHIAGLKSESPPVPCSWRQEIPDTKAGEKALLDSRDTCKGLTENTGKTVNVRRNAGHRLGTHTGDEDGLGETITDNIIVVACDNSALYKEKEQVAASFERNTAPNTIESSGECNTVAPSDEFNTVEPSDEFNKEAPSDEFNKEAHSDEFNTVEPSDEFNKEAPSDEFNTVEPSDELKKEAPSDEFNTVEPSDEYNTMAPSDEYNAVASSGEYNTVASSGEYNTVAPSKQYNTVPPSDEYNAMVPSDEYNTVAPSDEYNTVAPYEEYNPVAPSKEYNPVVPSEEYNIVAPSDDYNEVASSDEYNTVAPSEEFKTVAPSDEYNAVAPSEEYNTVTPSEEYNTVAPSKEYNTVAPSEEFKTVAPSDEYNAVAPSEEFKTVAPSDEYNTVAPSKEYNTVAPSDEYNTVAPSDEYNAVAPSEEYNKVMPSDEYKTVALSDELNTVAPSEECNSVAPSEEYNRVVPFEECNRVAPSEKYNTVAPSEEYNTVAPSEEYNTVAPSEEYNTVAPSEEYNTVAPSEEYNTVAPSEEYNTVAHSDKHNTMACTDETNIVRSSDDQFATISCGAKSSLAHSDETSAMTVFGGRCAGAACDDDDDETAECAPGQGFKVDPSLNLVLLRECQMAFVTDEDGDLPLHIATAQENVSMVERLVSMMKMSNMSVDHYNNSQETALHIAVLVQSPVIMEKLLEAGSSGNLSDRHGQTALHLVAKSGTKACMKVLLNKTKVKLDMNAKNYDGLCPLHVAVQARNTEVIQSLVKANADVNAKDATSGRTALIHAVETNQPHVVELLLRNGANINSQTHSGSTALGAATGRDLRSMVELLVHHGADFTMESPSDMQAYFARTSAAPAADTMAKPNKFLRNAARSSKLSYKIIGSPIVKVIYT